MKYLNLHQGNDTQAENTLSRKFARITNSTLCTLNFYRSTFTFQILCPSRSLCNLNYCSGVFIRSFGKSSCTFRLSLEWIPSKIGVLPSITLSFSISLFPAIFYRYKYWDLGPTTSPLPQLNHPFVSSFLSFQSISYSQNHFNALTILSTLLPRNPRLLLVQLSHILLPENQTRNFFPSRSPRNSMVTSLL